MNAEQSSLLFVEINFSNNKRPAETLKKDPFVQYGIKLLMA